MASIIGAASRPGIAYGFRSRPTCRSTPGARSARSRPSASRTRSTSSPIISLRTKARPRALKLKDRGLLREGYRADVTIFDPADFRDRATYADPHRYPSSKRTSVIVNGTIVVEDATHTGALPGKVLRRDRNGSVG